VFNENRCQEFFFNNTVIKQENIFSKDMIQHAFAAILCSNRIASEVTTLWRDRNVCIIVIIIKGT